MHISDQGICSHYGFKGRAAQTVLGYFRVDFRTYGKGQSNNKKRNWPAWDELRKEIVRDTESTRT